MQAVNTFRRHGRPFVLLALLAMLALALVPTVSRALTLWAGSPTAADLCAGDRKDAAPAKQLDACALCVLAAQAAGPLPPSPAMALPPAPAFETPCQAADAPRTPAFRAAAQPRAPPLPA